MSRRRRFNSLRASWTEWMSPTLRDLLQRMDCTVWIDVVINTQTTTGVCEHDNKMFQNATDSPFGMKWMHPQDACELTESNHILVWA